VPPDADSTTYDLIFGERRYPPKLVLSLACKHASGEEFDRGAFVGGEKSPAFRVLRELGFHIERKDFVEQLVREFLAQAQAQDDLSTTHYPRTYRGLSVVVSFGKGNFARIPWISFLGAGQKTSKGIYPGYLFFREIGVLLLTYGISEENESSVQWKNLPRVKSVREFLASQYQTTPERYGDAFVAAAYNVPRDVHGDVLTKDLDKVINEYQAIVADTTTAGVQAALGVEESEMESPTELVTSPYTVEMALEGLFLPREQFEEILHLLREKKNVIIEGPPGVGKTFFSKRLANAFMQEDGSDRLGMVQFHQSYAYEDFIQGYRPTGTGFALKDGIFHQFCTSARVDPENDYVFIIDEINRSNLSKVLGEVMMLIETDKRGEQWAIPLTYAKSAADRFFVPKNVHLIGLMNTADRSLSMVDYALRRRFAFVDLAPLFEAPGFRAHLLRRGTPAELIDKIVARMSALNEEIAKDKTNLGPGFCVGHSFFCTTPSDRNPDETWYRQVVNREIAPLLREYWFDDSTKADDWIRRLTA